jgi:endonuclease YncB( thermonuclease family)
MKINFPKFKNPFRYFYNNKKNMIKDNDTINIMEEYESNIKWEDTVEFTFPIKGGKVIKVYDGDTITIASRLPYDSSPLYRLSVRLNGIDTPEIKGKDISEEEKQEAILARDFVSKLILNKFVRLENIETEKYGRILADVYIDNIHLNELLIKNRYAVKYDGGTKKKPMSWLRYRLTGEL